MAAVLFVIEVLDMCAEKLVVVAFVVLMALAVAVVDVVEVALA
jgi:hypothetical protein